ncbi:tripartite tricarboxylate transporter substrate binding protein [Natrinema versiforme]|nr:tripartite tricarboxylate transporter substrate binding protein [Natrinema versiforme]
MNAAANATPNGHTIGLAAGEICMFQHLGISDLGPDSIKPIMQYTVTPSTVTVHEDSGWDTLEDFVSYAEDNSVTMSNSGTGGTYHIAGAGFALEAGIDGNVEHVPYDGGDPAITAVVNGEADVTASGAPEVAPQVNDGPLECLGVMADSEHSALPDVPTLADEGYDLQLGSWLANFVSTDVDDETYEQIVETWEEIYEDDDFVSFMEDGGYEMKQRTGDELDEFMSTQYEKYGEIISELGLDG